MAFGPEFEQNLLEHLDALYGYAMSLARDPTEAEDLVQETYLRAIKRAQHTLPTGNLKAWLFVILRNVWINQQRRAQGSISFLLGVDTDSGEFRHNGSTNDLQSPESLLEQRLLWRNVHNAIESLPKVFQEMMVLRYIEGFTYQQIAEILQCPSGTVMSRLNRARAALQHLYIQQSL
jgi:RNA polymerase sigma-70 factor (ECF subfamily)